MPSFIRGLSPVVVLLASWCAGQEPDSSERDSRAEKEAATKFRAFAKEVAAAYDLRAGEGRTRKLTQVAEPVLRWSNPLGGQRARGEIFLWTDSGQPAAVVSINEFTDDAGATKGEQEWCSLAAGPLVADGPHRWSPAAGVLTPMPLRDVDAPADSAARRLRQMHDLARRFAGEKTTRAGVTRTLRLLPKPIYRYESNDAGILDGALFALAEATDPEALLVLEARRADKTPVWHYALARMNSVRLTASYNGKPVWEAPALEAGEVFDRTDKAYSAFLRK
ncbi:MAG TPA: hypothetical protein VG125_22835 [Pirellulales bacterium]|jgi:hypothetical protein|nr:hypothetical protein [Pirellulales bacterium]